MLRRGLQDEANLTVRVKCAREIPRCLRLPMPEFINHQFPVALTQTRPLREFPDP